MDTQLFAEKLVVERKLFFFDLKENPRGRFLKITEEVGGRRNTVIIPSTGLQAFRQSLENMIVAESERPPLENVSMMAP